MNDKITQFKQQFTQRFSQQWKSQVAQNPNVQQAVQWYNAKPAREQLILKAIAALLVLALIWTIFYAPLIQSRKTARVELEKNLATYNLIASNAGRFSSSHSASGSQNDSILAAATNQARNKNINLSRYEQDGANLRVWLERAAFDDAITWLESLQNDYGISVSQISIDKTDTIGRVDIRATLAR